MKRVLISVIGLQHPYEGGEDADNAVEVITEGIYHMDKDGNGWFRYEESPMSELGSTVTTFYVNHNSARMVRTGFVKAEMEFDLTASKSFIYGTDYGGIPMTITTSSIINRLNENGGELTLNYSLAMNSIPFGENRFSFSIRELNA